MKDIDSMKLALKKMNPIQNTIDKYLDFLQNNYNEEQILMICQLLKEAPIMYENNFFIISQDAVAHLYIFMQWNELAGEKLLDIYIETVLNYARTKDIDIAQTIAVNLKTSLKLINENNIINYYESLLNKEVISPSKEIKENIAKKSFVL